MIVLSVVLRNIVFERSYSRYIYFTDCFLCGVFVFETTKTKTPKFTAKFDLKLRGKDRTEDNLTD